MPRVATAKTTRRKDKNYTSQFSCDVWHAKFHTQVSSVRTCETENRRLSFLTSLAYSQLWLRPNYFRSDVPNRKTSFFILHISRLFVTLA